MGIRDHMFHLICTTPESLLWIDSCCPVMERILASDGLLLSRFHLACQLRQAQQHDMYLAVCGRYFRSSDEDWSSSPESKNFTAEYSTSGGRDLCTPMWDNYLEVWEGAEDGDSQPHGLGIARFHGGDRYTGFMSHGRREGWGVNCSTEQVYAGHFRADKPEGRGCLLDLRNCMRSEGQFDHGVLVKGRLTCRDFVIEGTWAETQGDKLPGVFGMGRKLDLMASYLYEGIMEDSLPNGLGRVFMEQKRYVGHFQRGMLVYCRSFLTTEGNWYIGECQGSSRQGLGARLTRDGKFQVGHWEKDKPTLRGVVYMDECKHIEVVAYGENGEVLAQQVVADLSSAVKGAGKQPPLDLDDRAAVVSLVRALVEDPVGNAPQALMLLHRLREEAKAVFGQQPPKLEYVPVQPDVLFAPEEYVGARDEEGLAHGQGILMQANGDIYEGRWEHGKRQGQGRQLYSLSGDTFEGQWQNDAWLSGCWTSLEGRVVQAEHFLGHKVPHGLCVIGWPASPPERPQPVKVEALYDKGQMQKGDVRISCDDEYIFRGTVRATSGNEFDLPLRQYGLIFYLDEDQSMYEGDFDEKGRKTGGKGFLVKQTGDQVVYEGPFRKDLRDGGTGVELHRVTGRPYLLEVPFFGDQKHGKGYRATESCTNIMHHRYEHDQLVEVNQLGARQDERLLRVFQQLTKRIIKAEAEWPARIHGPFLPEDKDRPKDAKQHRLPSLPNVVRKSRPAGNAHFRLHNLPELVESDTHEVGGKGVPRPLPVGAPVPPPRPSVTKKASSPLARAVSPAQALKNAPRPVSPLELGDTQDLDYHPHVRTQRDIPPLQIPELKLTTSAQDTVARHSLASPVAGPGSNDDFQEVTYRKKPAQGNKVKEPARVKVTALVEPGWKAALVRVLLDEEVRVSQYTVNYFEVAKPAFIRHVQKSDGGEIVIRNLKNGVKYGFNVQVTYYVGDKKVTTQAKETVRTTPPGAVKQPPPPDQPDRVFVRPMGEDGQVLPLNDGQWPFAAYILGKDVSDLVLANKKYSIKVRLLHGDGHLAVEFCLAREIQEHAKKFTVWCREKPLPLEEGFRISAGASPVLIAGLRNGVTYDVSFKIKWSSGKYYPSEPASIIIEGRPEGPAETLEVAGAEAVVADPHLQQALHTDKETGIDAESALPVIAQLTSRSPLFDIQSKFLQSVNQQQQKQQQQQQKPQQAHMVMPQQSLDFAQAPSPKLGSGQLGAALHSPAVLQENQAAEPGHVVLGMEGLDLGGRGISDGTTSSATHSLLGQQPLPVPDAQQQQQQPDVLSVLQHVSSPSLHPSHFPLGHSPLLQPQRREPSPILRPQPPQVVQDLPSILQPHLGLSALDPPLPSDEDRPPLFQRCKAVTPPATENSATWKPPGSTYLAQATASSTYTQSQGPSSPFESFFAFSMVPWIESNHQQQPPQQQPPQQQPPQQPQQPQQQGPGQSELSAQAPQGHYLQHQQSPFVSGGIGQQPYDAHQQHYSQPQQHYPQNAQSYPQQQAHPNGQQWAGGRF